MIKDWINKVLLLRNYIRNETILEKKKEFDGKKYFYLNSDQYQILYIFRGNTLKTVRKISLLQDYLKTNLSDNLFPNEDQFVLYLQELFISGKKLKNLIDHSVNRIINDLDLIVHPIRLAIMKLLQKYYQLSRTTLLKRIPVSESTLDRNMQRLKENKLIDVDYCVYQ